MVEILYNGMPFAHLPNLGVFTPWTLASAPHCPHLFFPTWLLSIYQHILAPSKLTYAMLVRRQEKKTEGD